MRPPEHPIDETGHRVVTVHPLGSDDASRLRGHRTCRFTEDLGQVDGVDHLTGDPGQVQTSQYRFHVHAGDDIVGLDPLHDRVEVDTGRDPVHVDAVHDRVEVDTGHDGVDVDPIHDGIEIHTGHDGVDVDPAHDGVEIHTGHDGVDVDPAHDGVEIHTGHDGVEVCPCHHGVDVGTGHHGIDVDARSKRIEVDMSADQLGEVDRREGRLPRPSQRLGRRAVQPVPDLLTAGGESGDQREAGCPGEELAAEPEHADGSRGGRPHHSGPGQTGRTGADAEGHVEAVSDRQQVSGVAPLVAVHRGTVAGTGAVALIPSG